MSTTAARLNPGVVEPAPKVGLPYQETLRY
jgi:hypothetical protein